MSQVDTMSQKDEHLKNGLADNPKNAEGNGSGQDINPKDIVVTRQVVEKIMKSYDPSLEVLDFTSEAGSNIGDNYMAIMYSVDIRVKNPKKNDEISTHHVMLKTMPLNPARQGMINESGAFVKEVLM